MRIVDADRLRRLLEMNRTIMAELDLDGVLARVLQVARAETGAAYAAIGVLDGALAGRALPDRGRDDATTPPRSVTCRAGAACSGC